LTWAGQGFLTKHFSATTLLDQRKNELKQRKKGFAGDVSTEGQEQIPAIPPTSILPYLAKTIPIYGFQPHQTAERKQMLPFWSKTNSRITARPNQNDRQSRIFLKRKVLIFCSVKWRS
jgi:hypothetical protein